jgi:hypothetical protein
MSQKFNGRYSTARGSPDPAHTINTKFDTADEGTVLNSGEHTQMRILNAQGSSRTGARPIRAGKIKSSTVVPTLNEVQTIQSPTNKKGTARPTTMQANYLQVELNDAHLRSSQPVPISKAAI